MLTVSITSEPHRAAPASSLPSLLSCSQRESLASNSVYLLSPCLMRAAETAPEPASLCLPHCASLPPKPPCMKVEVSQRTAGICCALGSPLQLEAHLLGDIQALGASRLESASLIYREVPCLQAPGTGCGGALLGDESSSTK